MITASGDAMGKYGPVVESPPTVMKMDPRHLRARQRYAVLSGKKKFCWDEAQGRVTSPMACGS